METKRKKVLVLMSGGVDSAMAGLLLREQGYEVIGITMHHLKAETSGEARHELLMKDAADARAVAVRFGFSHHIIDLSEEFETTIIKPFTEEYLKGRTPNPCVDCNAGIKLGILIEKAASLDVDSVATGHYSRVEHDPVSGRYVLKKAVDSAKDQSYYLSRLSQEQLSRLVLPLGEMTKKEIKVLARRLNLPMAHKKESQEVCFIPNDDYRAFLLGRLGEENVLKEGLIVNSAGTTLGRHKGVANYTIGQRKGLGIAHTCPLYVIRIDAASNTVVVGEKEEALSRTLEARDIHWMSIAALENPARVTAQIRYRHTPGDAVVTPKSQDCIVVEFDEPQLAVTPGQRVVLYDGEVVVGSGCIVSSS